MPMLGDQVNKGEMTARLEAIQGSIGEIKERLDTMGAALVNLTRLETLHTQHSEALGRAFTEIRLVQERSERMEREMPGLIEMRKWIVTGVVAGLAMILGALFKLAIVDPSLQQENMTSAITTAVVEALKAKP